MQKCRAQRKKHPSSYLTLLNIVWQLKYSSGSYCSQQGGKSWTFSCTKWVVCLSCSLRMSVSLLHLSGLVPTSPAKLGILHCSVPASASGTHGAICGYLSDRDHLWKSSFSFPERGNSMDVAPAKDSKVVRKFWILHVWRPSHPNKSMQHALIWPALSWEPKWWWKKQWMAVAEFLPPDKSPEQNAPTQEKLLVSAGNLFQTRKDYFLIITQHTPAIQAQNYLKISVSSAAFPTSPGRCVKHL